MYRVREKLRKDAVVLTIVEVDIVCLLPGSKIDIRYFYVSL